MYNKTIQRVIAISLVLWGIQSTGQTEERGWQKGQSLPDLSTFNLEGPLPQLEGKVILIDFWASWCGPCRKSFPFLNELHRQYRERGVVVLGISVDKKDLAMRRFLEKIPAEFPVLRDAEHNLIQSAQAKTMPTSFLVTPQGLIAHVYEGFHGKESEATIKKHIEEILP